MNINETRFIGHEQAKGDNNLNAIIKALIEKHGEEDFLLSVVAGLKDTHPRSSNKINEIRYDLWTNKGYR